MESYAIAIVLVIAVWLVISYVAANTFYAIACMKGHNDRKYFWWCFLLLPVGKSMVIALPDRQNNSGNTSKSADPKNNSADPRKYVASDLRSMRRF